MERPKLPAGKIEIEGIGFFDADKAPKTLTKSHL